MATTRKRTRLSKGVYTDQWGVAVVYYVNSVRKEQRFPAGTPLEKLKAWRKTQIGQQQELAPRDPKGSLARDVVTYLKRLKGTAGYKSEKSHLRAWLQRFPRAMRWQLTREKIELTVASWRQQKYAPRTIRHRLRALESLFHRLDGSRAPTPLDDVKPPAKPQPRPVSVSDDTIAAVALNLHKHEIAGQLRDGKTRARYLVLATHSQRPIEVQRAQPIDVDLERRLWAVRGAKGGYNIVVPLNHEQAAAWALFFAANAWGHYDERSFVRTLHRNGWPKGIRPYNLRHSTGLALSAKNVDLGDIQGLIRHTSPETTRRFYVPGLIERLAAATEKIDGRFSVSAFSALPRSFSNKSRAETAKDGEKPKEVDHGTGRTGHRSRSLRSRKTA